MSLRYRSGEEIKKGDQVRFHGNLAQVEFVASADNPQYAWYVHEYGGGVMCFDPVVSGRTFIPADQLPDSEDLEFVSRPKIE
jgi:hypothetical protein